MRLVIPANAGIQVHPGSLALRGLGSRIRGNDSEKVVPSEMLPAGLRIPFTRPAPKK
jgi:hypothetical protein